MALRKLLIPFMLATFLPLYALAEDDREIWECNTGAYYYETAKHNLWLVKGSELNYVKFYDTRIPARFYLHGLERRWDWEGGNFSIRLSPENDAWYFDFSSSEPGETISSKTKFACKKIQG